MAFRVEIALEEAMDLL